MISRSRALTDRSNPESATQPPLSQQAQALDLLPVLVRDARDVIIYWSQGAEALYGFTPEEALGHISHELLHTRFSEPLHHIQCTLRSGKPWHGELTHTCKDGSLVVVSSQWVPSRVHRTRTRTTIEISTDITEHKRAEQAHDRLAAIVESSEDAIISKSLEGHIISWNSAAERLFGYRSEEVLGRSIDLITPPDRQAEAAIVLERLRAGEHIEPFETVRLTKAGRRLDVSLTISPVRDAAGNIIGASKILRDISEQKRAEQAAQIARETTHRRQIERREQILSAMMEHIRLGIAIADAPAVTIRMVSRHGRNLLQKPKEQILGAASEQHPAAFAFFHLDGTPAIPQEMPLTRATTQGEVIPGEEWVVARRDGVRIPILCTAAPICDHKNRIIGGVMGWQDLSRPKQAEKALRKAQADLRAHANTLEKTIAARTRTLRETVAELEAFSYSISHDIRAPIRAIHSYAEVALLRNKGRPDPRTQELLQKIISCAQSTDRLIEDILALSRLSRQHIPLAPVDTERLIRELLRERPEVKASGAQISIQSPLDSFLAHETSLRQGLTNLLSNAVKFVAPGMQPRIEIWTEAIPAPASQPSPTGWVRLYIRDNGIGIAPEEHQKVFQLFYRAPQQQKFEGTGLGLAIVKKAVERMGGSVGFESSPGQGSCFWIDLPKAPISEAGPPKIRSGHTQTQSIDASRNENDLKA